MYGKVTLLAADDGHPNRHPFSGVLTYLNASSDKPVGGAGGRLVYIAADVGEAALHTLQGMAVNVRSDLAGHDPTLKVGVIEKAYLGDALADGSIPVHVEGYLFAHDFPDIVESLVANQDALGFSYETTSTKAIVEGGRLVVTSLVFTGASILYKNKAAYSSTSLAAESEDEMNEEQLKEMLQAMGMDMSSLEEMLVMFKTMKQRMSEKGVYADMSMYLSAGADIAETVDALKGEVETLKASLTASGEKVAALEAALADAQTRLQASADVETVAKSDYDTLKASHDELKTKVDALTAEADEKAKYERKSVASVNLVAKWNIEEKDSLQASIEAVGKREDLGPVEKLTAIMELQAKAAKEAK